MRFIETRFKNVLSFGFDEEFIVPYDTSTFNMVFGDNGVGKTNFTKLIEIGVYFEYPESVGDVKNRYAKEDGHIEHTIKSNGHVWKIKSIFGRGLKKITVHKDDELQDWGNVSSVQKKILEYIVDVPFSIFKNILCSSMDNVNSILKLNAKDSKEIVNQVFDISDIGLVGEYTSKHHFSKNKSLSDKKVEKETLENNLESQKELFENFKKNDTKEEEKKLNSFKDDLKKYLEENDSIKENISHVNDILSFIEKSIVSNNIASLKKLLSEINDDITSTDCLIKISESKIKFYDKKLKEISLKSLKSDLTTKSDEIKIISDKKDGLEKTLKKMSDVAKNKAIHSLISSIEKEIEILSEKSGDYNKNIDKKKELDEEYETLSKKKEDHKRFTLYFASLSDTNAIADKIKTDLKPKLESKKTLLLDLEDKKIKLDEKLVKQKSDLSDVQKHIDFMENPVCNVKGCNMDFSSDENTKLLEESVVKKKSLLSEIDITKDLIDSMKKDIDLVKDDIDITKDLLLTSVNKVKSFVKDEFYGGFEISFNEGVDLKYFEEKFKVDFSEQDLEDFTKIGFDLETIGKTIIEKKKEIDNSNNSINFSKKTLLSSYDVSDYKDVVFSETDIDEMNNFSEEDKDEKTKEFSDLLKQHSEMSSDIAVLENKISDVEKLLIVIGETDVYDVDENELDPLISSEKTLLEEYNKIMVEKSKFEVENITKLGLMEKEFEKFNDFDFSTDLDEEISLEEHNEIFTKNKNILEKNLELSDENVTVTRTNIKNIEESDSKEKYSVFDEAIKEATSKIQDVDVDVKKLHEEFKSAELLKELYNNGWLKNELIGQVVGGINNIIRDITERYDIPVSCEFDSGFNSILYKYGVETKYGMCSLGQRKMLSLISIIAIVSYYKQVYPQINFIFLDEALSSLTEVNVNKMVSVINEHLVSRLGMTVFISHHSFLKSSYFDNIYKLEEMNIMTKVTVVNEN